MLNMCLNFCNVALFSLLIAELATAMVMGVVSVLLQQKVFLCFLSLKQFVGNGTMYMLLVGHSIFFLCRVKHVASGTVHYRTLCNTLR